MVDELEQERRAVTDIQIVGFADVHPSAIGDAQSLLAEYQPPAVVLCDSPVLVDSCGAEFYAAVAA